MYMHRASFILAVVAIFQLSFANPILNDQLEDTRRALSDDDEEMLWKRTEFPDYPPSCKLCEPHFDEIQSCANASVVFSNIAQILYNPISFLDVIECACADTFYSAYPQCVDCLIQTNQTGFLVPQNGNLSSVVTGMREICALGSAVFGGVASHNSQLPGQTPITVPSGGAAVRRIKSLLGASLGLVPNGGPGIVVALFSVVLGFGMGVWTVL